MLILSNDTFVYVAPSSLSFKWTARGACPLFVQSRQFALNCVYLAFCRRANRRPIFLYSFLFFMICLHDVYLWLTGGTTQLHIFQIHVDPLAYKCNKITTRPFFFIDILKYLTPIHSVCILRRRTSINMRFSLKPEKWS